MGELKYDQNNFRLHGDKNKRIILKSLSECGAGRSILIDSNDCIISGNGVYEQAQTLGIPIKVIETDGNTLIAVKRLDLKTNDERRQLLAFADNYASDTSIFNETILLETFSAEQLEGYEFSLDVESGVLADLEKGGFMSAVKDAAPTFQVSFAIPKEKKDQYDAYVRENGKEKLLNVIINEICQPVVVK